MATSLSCTGRMTLVGDRRYRPLGTSVETEEVVVDGGREPTHRGDWSLTIVSARAPELVGRVVPIQWTGCEVGRQPQGVRPPIALNDPTLSRSHVLLDPLGHGRGVQVHDCGSRNGVYVNGTKAQAAEISHRTVLRMGHVLTVLTCGLPPSDWKGVRADLPHLANTLAPRPDQLPWSAVIDSLAWERILLHQWRGDEAEVRQFFQELVSYAQVTDQAVAMLLNARAKAIEVGRQWGLRRPSREDLQNLLDVYGGRIVDVATHLGVDRRQIYRWLEYDRRGESTERSDDEAGVDEP